MNRDVGTMDPRDGRLSAYLAESVPGAIATGSVKVFNAEFFVAAPHAVAIEFDLSGQRRSPDASGLG